MPRSAIMNRAPQHSHFRCADDQARPEIEIMNTHLAEVHGLAAAWVKEFWSWPYRFVINFVHRLSSSADTRRTHVFPREYLTSLPGVERTDRTSPEDLIGQKIMRKRLLFLRILYAFCFSGRERISAAIEFKGLENLEAVQGSGITVILATPHVGIGQIGPHSLAQVDFSIAVLGGAVPRRLLGLPEHEKRQLLRPKEQAPLEVAKGMKALKAGPFLVMAADGRQGREANERRFLARMRSFKNGLLYCAKRAEARLILWQVTMNSLGGSTLEIFREIIPFDTGCSDDARAEAITLNNMAILELYLMTLFGNVSDGDVQEYLALPDAPRQSR
jgi:lauroyl/myristoyl acyltransferase